jgi:endonuclease/exonuclease/phosphatase family metal-dependent hydrolase
MLSILSYNLLYDHPRWGEEYRWVLRKAGVLALLRKYAPDVIGVQELTAGMYADLRAMLPDYDCSAPVAAPGQEEVDPWIFNATFFLRSRLELLQEEILWLSRFPDGTPQITDKRCRLAVCCLLADRQTGERFQHINTHFPVDEASRRAVADDFFAMCERQSIGVPQVIGGDFNTLDLAVQAGAHGYADAACVSLIPPEGPTGSRIDRTTQQVVANSTVDHLFVSQGLDVAGFTTIDDRMHGGYPSDHLPIMAHMLFQG